MKRCYLLITLVACVSAAVAQQQPRQSTPPKAEPQDEEVVRISTTLVQVDALVTGKGGKPVTDLRAEDFEVFEDGRPQRISNFSYVETRTDAVATTPVPPGAAKAAGGAPPPPAPPARLRPEEVRRTIVFVIDAMTYESLTRTRKALKKFVDEQMQPGDLVAVMRAGQGMSALQQFTTDRRLLHMALDGLRWMPTELYGVEAVPTETPDTSRIAPAETSAEPEERRFRQQERMRGKLAALSLIVSELEPLPGRKELFLFSDSFRLFGSAWDGHDNQRVTEDLRLLSGQANRALVVFNAVDARELQPLNIGASEAMDMDQNRGGSLKEISTDKTAASVGEARQARWRNFQAEQDGLYRLAKGTGGRFVHDGDAARAVADVLGDAEGYYLIGYTLDEKSFNSDAARRHFHKIEVRVKRPGLSVRTRKEFYGVPRREAALSPRTNAQKLLAALTSPYYQGGVRMRLTSLFGHDEREGSFVRSLLHLDARDLTFEEEADGRLRATVRLVAVAFDERGLVGNPVTQSYAVRARRETVEALRREGVIYEMMVPVDKAGVYQVRAAVQDAASERIGAAAQLIEVPDVAAGRLALSGLVVSGIEQAKGEGAAAGVAGAGSVQATTAVRKFRRGMRVSYAFIAYNAQAATGPPQREARLSLYREGRTVYTTPLALPAPRAESKQIVVSGALTLGTELTPGEYVLQVAVTERLDKGQYTTATRWIDFDLVE